MTTGLIAQGDACGGSVLIGNGEGRQRKLSFKSCDFAEKWISYSKATISYNTKRIACPFLNVIVSLHKINNGEYE